MWILGLVAIVCMVIGFSVIIIMLIDGHKVLVWHPPVSIEPEPEQVGRHEQSSI